jgi:hypothetical protein
MKIMNECSSYPCPQKIHFTGVAYVHTQIRPRPFLRLYPMAHKSSIVDYFPYVPGSTQNCRTFRPEEFFTTCHRSIVFVSIR